MAIAVPARPLVDLALPQNGAARLGAQIVLAVLGTLLLTLSAKTKVVLGPVDMSLQTLAVLLIAASFGFRLGVATLLLYLAEGAMGFPVFQSSPEKGVGIAYMLGTTGGYLAGFVVMVAGDADRRGKGLGVRRCPLHRGRPDQGRAGGGPCSCRLVAAAEARLSPACSA